MGFTAPVTRATDFLVTAAVWNAEHVDNMNTAWPHLIARKTSDESITSSTVLQDDNDLLFAVGASDVWQFSVFMRYEAGTGGDMGLSFGIPASGRIDAHAVVNDASNILSRQKWAMTATDGATGTFEGLGAASIITAIIDGIYIGGGTAGNVVVRWAQQTSNGTATIMKAHSTLWGVKLA